MENFYRHTPPSLSLVERALARLVKRRLLPSSSTARLDLVHNAHLELSQE